ncbi:hypothetical protein [Gemmatimonas sp.]|uniref:hypothetical protein n=1 Tax=Gemmatimonas sp. TaxID=1962908 RepID=UPI0035624F7B
MLFRGTAAKPSPTISARAPRRPDEILQAHESAIEETKGRGLVWLARDSNFWVERTEQVLARLEDEWARNPEAAQ